MNGVRRAELSPHARVMTVERGQMHEVLASRGSVWGLSLTISSWVSGTEAGGFVSVNVPWMPV